MTKKKSKVDEIVDDLEDVDNEVNDEFEDQQDDEDSQEEELSKIPYKIHLVTLINGDNFVGYSRTDGEVFEFFCPLLVHTDFHPSAGAKTHLSIPNPYTADRVYLIPNARVMYISKPRYEIAKEYLTIYQLAYEEVETIDADLADEDQRELDEQRLAEKVKQANTGEGLVEATDERVLEVVSDGLLINKKSDRVPEGFHIGNLVFKDDTKPN